jgi:outer membrane protein
METVDHSACVSICQSGQVSRKTVSPELHDGPTFSSLPGRIHKPERILPVSSLRGSALRAVVIVLWLISAIETRAQAKIGTVDTDRVLKEYHKSKEAESKLNEAAKAAKKEFDDRVEAYKKALDEVKKLNAQIEGPVLSADARAAKAKERDEQIARIKNMEREINDFRQTREQQLQQQMLRVREGIVKEIADIVMERGKSRNLDLIFDKSGASLNRFSPILFSPDSMDFTAEIIAELNKKSPTTSPTVARTAAKP